MAIKDRLVSDVLFQRLQPLAIAKYWNLIQQCLVESLEGQTASTGFLNRLMAAVQSGKIQVWSALATGKPPVLIGMVFTQVFGDPILGTSDLCVYGLTLRAQASPEVYAHCLSELEGYAKQCGCQRVVAQTAKSGVKRLLEANGWSNGACTLKKEI